LEYWIPAIKPIPWERITAWGSRMTAEKAGMKYSTGFVPMFRTAFDALDWCYPQVNEAINTVTGHQAMFNDRREVVFFNSRGPTA
jgi:hypothetical protein